MLNNNRTPFYVHVHLMPLIYQLHVHVWCCFIELFKRLIFKQTTDNACWNQNFLKIYKNCKVAVTIKMLVTTVVTATSALNRKKSVTISETSVILKNTKNWEYLNANGIHGPLTNSTWYFRTFSRARRWNEKGVLFRIYISLKCF